MRKGEKTPSVPDTAKVIEQRFVNTIELFLMTILRQNNSGLYQFQVVQSGWVSMPVDEHHLQVCCSTASHPRHALSEMPDTVNREGFFQESLSKRGPCAFDDFCGLVRCAGDSDDGHFAVQHSMAMQLRHVLQIRNHHRPLQCNSRIE